MAKTTRKRTREKGQWLNLSGQYAWRKIHVAKKTGASKRAYYMAKKANRSYQKKMLAAMGAKVPKRKGSAKARVARQNAKERVAAKALLPVVRRIVAADNEKRKVYDRFDDHPLRYPSEALNPPLTLDEQGAVAIQPLRADTTGILHSTSFMLGMSKKVAADEVDDYQTDRWFYRLGNKLRLLSFKVNYTFQVLWPAMPAEQFERQWVQCEHYVFKFRSERSAAVFAANSVGGREYRQKIYNTLANSPVDPAGLVGDDNLRFLPVKNLDRVPPVTVDMRPAGVQDVRKDFQLVNVKKTRHYRPRVPPAYSAVGHQRIVEQHFHETGHGGANQLIAAGSPLPLEMATVGASSTAVPATGLLLDQHLREAEHHITVPDVVSRPFSPEQRSQFSVSFAHTWPEGYDFVYTDVEGQNATNLMYARNDMAVLQVWRSYANRPHSASPTPAALAEIIYGAVQIKAVDP